MSNRIEPDEDRLEIPFLDHCFIERPAPKDGKGFAAIQPRRELNNSMNIAHGGVLMTLMDAAMGGAARSLQKPGVTVVTIDMQVAFLGPARGRIEAHGVVTKATRSFVFTQCEVLNEAGELVARGTGLFRPVDRARMTGTA